MANFGENNSEVGQADAHEDFLTSAVTIPPAPAANDKIESQFRENSK